nr:hypothetical protein [Tanacetum cinerariifolium]
CIRTRSSSNLPVESPPNPSTSNPKRRNRRRSKQPFILEESPVDTMADQRTMAELLRAPTEGYAEEIVGQPVGGSKKNPSRSILSWEDLVSKFINEFFPSQQQQIFVMKFQTFNNGLMNRFRRHGIDTKISFVDANSSSSEMAKLTHAVYQQTSDVTTAMTTILKQFQANPPPASVKAVEEICVTCGGAHPYYQCLAADGNTFPELRDNIQGYVAAVAVNYNQGNSGYRHPGVGSGHLPSNTIANLKGELKSITIRSGIVVDGPFISIHPPFINPAKDERVEETLTDQDLAEYTIKIPPPLVQKSKPPSQRNFVMNQRDPLHPNIPYPSRMHKFNLKRVSLTGFPAQSIRSSNAIALDSPYLLVLITGTSQSRQHDTTPTVTPPTTHVDTTLTPTEIPRVSPIILPSPDYTPASPDYSSASDTEFDPSEDPLSDHIPPLPATLPFLSSFNDSSDNDTPDTTPSLTHGTPFTEICPPTQSLPAASATLHRRVMILAPGQPIHHDLFTSDDSSETSSDSSSDDLSDSSFGHSSSDHSSPTLPSGMRSSHQLCSSGASIPYSSTVITKRPSHSSFVGPSRKRSRSPTTSVLLSSPIPRALSSACADLLPPPKRIRIDDFVTDLENCTDKSSDSSILRETSLRDDVVVRGCDEPHSEPDIDPKILADIDECIAYVDALRAEGINARVVVETVAREEVETRDSVKVKVKRVTHPAVPDDIPKPAQEEGAIEGTCETLGDMVHKTVTTCQQSVVLSKRISQLERDNTRLRGTLDVASQRVSRLQRRELKIPNTLSGATMTREEVNELIARRVAEALEARDAVRNLEPLVEGGGEQEDKNGDDYGGGIRRRNGNGGVNGNGGNGNGGGDENGNGNGNKGMAITLKVSCLLLKSAHIWTS